MLGETAAKKVAQIPLSNDTITRRNDDMAGDILAQLIEQLNLFKSFSM